MGLNKDNIYSFTNELIKKFKINIVITQGFKKVDVFESFKNKYFKNKKINNK